MISPTKKPIKKPQAKPIQKSIIAPPRYQDFLSVTLKINFRFCGDGHDVAVLFECLLDCPLLLQRVNRGALVRFALAVRPP